MLHFARAWSPGVTAPTLPKLGASSSDAVEWLGKAYQACVGLFYNLKVEPQLCRSMAPLRDDPRFQDLRRMNLEP